LLKSITLGRPISSCGTTLFCTVLRKIPELGATSRAGRNASDIRCGSRNPEDWHSGRQAGASGARYGLCLTAVVSAGLGMGATMPHAKIPRFAIIPSGIPRVTRGQPFHSDLHGLIRQRNPADQPRRGDAAFVSRLRHER